MSPPTKTVRAEIVDASSVTAPPAAPPPSATPPPKLRCGSETAIVVAPAPEPTWFCARANGVRHGPFVTEFPDATIEITGSYTDGLLDGPWTRRHPGGAVAERGNYVAGVKDGRWTQTSSLGAVLGTYTLSQGTGIEKVWYESGPVYSERTLAAGEPHGPYKVYGLDGTVVISARYVDGALDGAHTFGTRSTMRFEETLARGVVTGRRAIWLNGVQIADEGYDRRGRLDGPYTLWRRPRVLRANGAFRAGKRVGPWQWVDRWNHVERAGTYVDGERDGLWQQWVQGTPALRGTYVDGKPEGTFVAYDRRGRELGTSSLSGGTGTLLTFHANKRPASKQRFENGVPHGLYQELTPRGAVVVVGRYLRGAKHGTWKTWTAGGVPLLVQTWKSGRLHGPLQKLVNGQLAMEATYVDGKVHGAYAEYRDGRRAVTGHYDGDLKDGTWITYDAEGRIVLSATYERGVLEGPWRQVIDGEVIEGTLVGGRRAGTWTRTDRAGTVSKLTYPTP